MQRDLRAVGALPASISAMWRPTAVRCAMLHRGEHGARSAERQRRFRHPPFTRQMLRKCTAQRYFRIRRRVVRQTFTQVFFDGFRRSASGVQRLRQAEMPGSIRRFQFQRATCSAFCGADLSLFK
jgi:hypothetical protein